ncbi:TetR/AcrR family transcriptional regulator [Cryobacterium psychrophilum]|uniref:TetR/AcrR family transcriptional regulator n=1 Tax=Cryobacterium psychrophilum TaxID=41988 RepID=A0A4Y8KJI1_9MICO|nr:TetR/AcrR family transcriptional regulator [Cryobacterium psychrophilum]TDW28829.1 TetR family transcriptional regulator [Cryobacterium psychrophilum]TFD76200.1 TetR/AcrR family transcriptional regulator [Cryobacterium psychrophilum]
MTITQPKSARGHNRRELILRSAAELMAERGYPAVSMTQIGAAAGIVGSGVYRHFESKSMLLSALLDRVVKNMLAGTRAVVASGLTGPDLLDEMIRAQTQIAIDNRSLVAVYLRDAGNLPVEGLRTLRRQQRQLVEEWIFQGESVAPYAGEMQLRTVVHAVFALINSVCTYDNPLPSARLVESISTMARATLHAGLGLETASTN